MSNSTQVRPVVAALIHVDRRKDGHNEANRRFSRLCEIA
jgi:hypothetical protein